MSSSPKENPGLHELTKDVRLLAEKLTAIISRRPLSPEVFASQHCLGKIEASLVNSLGIERERAREIAFHLSDWLIDAGFLIALSSTPEEFSDEEVAESVVSFLAHVPNHVAAAAKLFGLPIQDIFEVGVFEHDDE